MVLSHRRKPPIQSPHNSKHQTCCQTWQSRYTLEHTTSVAIDQQSQPGGGGGGGGGDGGGGGGRG